MRADYICLGITFPEKYRATDMKSNNIIAVYIGLVIIFSEKYRATGMKCNTMRSWYYFFRKIQSHRHE